MDLPKSELHSLNFLFAYYDFVDRTMSSAQSLFNANWFLGFSCMFSARLCHKHDFTVKYDV